MELLIFDLDGVLLQPNGYHRALQETVRLAGISLGFKNVVLSEQHISQFEALGISSEWHSSALCMFVMWLDKQEGKIFQGNGRRKDEISTDLQPYDLNLEDLIEAIAAQPIHSPPSYRAQTAVDILVQRAGVDPNLASGIVDTCESIDHSLTLNIFQELVLGSEMFELTYNKIPQLHTDSFLHLYDQPNLGKLNKTKLLSWVRESGHGAAIMTNRPSNTLLAGSGTPEAEMGAALVGLDDIPLVGLGEMTWLAQKSHQEVGALIKPSWQHALAAILAASGWEVAKSLAYIGGIISEKEFQDLTYLHNSTITVFEDTPGGVTSIECVRNLLAKSNIGVQIRKIGISEDESKREALTAYGADVYPNIDDALYSLEYF